MKYLIYFISCLMLFSCSSRQEGKVKNENIDTTELAGQAEKNETEVYDANEIIEGFRSELRVGKTEWNEEDTFTDTLELVEYNTDFDYYFAVFRDRKGKEVAIHTNEEIDDFYRNRNFTVKWKVGKFYEAGEGDAIYYREQLVSFELLKTSFSFEIFLNQFTEVYKNGKRADIKKHIHRLAELVSTYNPGLYCVEGRPNDLPQPGYFSGEYIITSEKPAGDFCEGYEGAKDGLYYEFFDEAHDLFPRVYDMSEEGGMERTLYITEDILYRYFVKVMVITEGYFNRHLYFFLEQDRWYFWVEDYCDCSA